MPHSSIGNFTTFGTKAATKETSEEIIKHAKMKAKIARSFILKMGKCQQIELAEYFSTLRSLTEIDNQFRELIDWQMETKGSVSTFISEHM